MSAQRLHAAAIKALREGDDPLHISFLSKHGVTLDEAYDLADDMATGLALLGGVREDLREGGLARHVGAHRLVRALVAAAPASPASPEEER